MSVFKSTINSITNCLTKNTSNIAMNDTTNIIINSLSNNTNKNGTNHIILITMSFFANVVNQIKLALKNC